MAEDIVEARGIEWVPASERHGRPSQLFTLWFSANLGMPALLVGVLGPVLGLSIGQTLWAVLLGNLLASTLLALVAQAGTGQGLAQLPLVRSVFGRLGNYVPSFLNTLSATGWYTINTAIGGEAVSRLLQWPLGWSLALLAAAQVALGYLGYGVIVRFERIMAAVQAVLFLLMTVIGWHLVAHLPAARPASYGPFLLEVAAVASYSFSWAPYASDYGRYLPETTPPRHVFWATFTGSFAATLWVELLGAVAGAMGWGALSPVAMVSRWMGALTVWALLAIAFGTMTANAVNVYTATLSFLTLDIRVRRTHAAAALGVAGWILAWSANAHLLSDYENFLLLLSYWVAPWIGIVLVAKARGYISKDQALGAPRWRWPALWAFVAGLIAVVPFMSTTLFEGPIARILDNGDTGYYAGFLVAAVVYGWLSRPESRMAASRSAQG
ncbi:cytosine permease [Sulfobacillus sp. hq2]|uniref:purine-cytosine permease family protein n=1 Tax=Sulfobacillus TaxID=28033 RepID=UPI000CD13B4D|nr:cytosine permease [Sulfobacillus sp. hq2]POB11997.1 hypothetical protein CO251_01725 [Sulfobacillus sp. hq2]